jgi:hypothetical protein
MAYTIFFTTQPPLPSDTIFGCSPEIPIKFLHFSQRTNMEAYFNLFMSVSVGKCFSVGSEDMTRVAIRAPEPPPDTYNNMSISHEICQVSRACG